MSEESKTCPKSFNDGWRVGYGLGIADVAEVREAAYKKGQKDMLDRISAQFMKEVDEAMERLNGN